VHLHKVADASTLANAAYEERLAVLRVDRADEYRRQVGLPFVRPVPQASALRFRWTFFDGFV